MLSDNGYSRQCCRRRMLCFIVSPIHKAAVGLFKPINGLSTGHAPYHCVNFIITIVTNETSDCCCCCCCCYDKHVPAIATLLNRAIVLRRWGRFTRKPVAYGEGPPVTYAYGEGPPVTYGLMLAVAYGEGPPVTYGLTLPVAYSEGPPVTHGLKSPPAYGEGPPVTYGLTLPAAYGEGPPATYGLTLAAAAVYHQLLRGVSVGSGADQQTRPPRPDPSPGGASEAATRL